MPKILSIFNSKLTPKAFLLCLVFLSVTEFTVSQYENRLRPLSDSVMEYKSYLLNTQGNKRYDAVVFGDSRILSLNARYISEHVSEKLGRDFELYNFAVPNHGVSTYYLLLKKYLKNHPAPRHILFSSAPVNLSGDWSVEKSEGRSEALHRMCQLYSLKELSDVLPFRTMLKALTVKAERISFLVLYRGVIKKGLHKYYKNIIKKGPANLNDYFIDSMTTSIQACIKYNGGVIFERNKVVTEVEITANKYYNWILEIDHGMDFWYQKFFALAQENGIRVLIINAPVYHDILQNSERNGSNQTYRRAVERWQSKYSNIEVLGPLLQPYTIEHFNDWQHLNVPGTRQFTFSVTDYLTEYLKTRP